MDQPAERALYRFEFTVPASAIDENGHVNNVMYVQWMQDAAVKHYAFLGGLEPTRVLGATWVVRSHHVEYLSPAFVGEALEAHTWVADVRRVRSLRRYEFLRKADGKLIARGETDWVFVDAQTGRPLAIPAEVSRLFSLLPDKK